MFTIRQTADGWEVLAGSAVLAATATYDDAVAHLAGMLAEAEPTSEDGLLPERWTSTTGIAFNEAPDPERDFTNCTWSFRDPGTYPLPLMLQTATDVGHFGAVLAGFIDTTGTDPNPTASGRFYDSDAGRQFRDLLLDGRRFGVSVDPDPQVTEAEYVCTEMDEDGFCIAGSWSFLTYQIAGLTGTPFPAFPLATIELEGNAPADTGDEPAAEDEAEPIAASARLARPTVTAAGSRFPIEPPRAWLEEPEPELGDPRLVEQADGSLACPLYIGDDGQLYGHLARVDQCHVSFLNECVMPPMDVAGFHIGETVCDDGTRLASGPLIVSTDHPGRHLAAAEALDAYAHTGLAWADARVTPGVFGNWCAGAVRPGVSDELLRVLRGSALSGDWRELYDAPGVLSLIATLTVSVPGFPIRRALAASAGVEVPEARQSVLVRGGRIVAASGVGLVRPCSTCGQAKGKAPAGHADLAAIRHTLALLERRTRHLAAPAAEALRARLTAGG